MNNGKCWMTTSDLDPQKNLNNVEEFEGYANYLRDNKNDLYKHLLVSDELSIDTNKELAIVQI